MKTPSERGIIGAWAYQARTEVGLSVEQVAERVGARGQAVSPATIRGIESGNKQPGGRLLRLLGEVLESTPPGERRSASDLSLEERAVAAAERQAVAAERQADALAMIAWAMVSDRGALPAQPDQQARIERFASEVLERMTSPLPTARPVG